jgi:hypothetical protein
MNTNRILLLLALVSPAAFAVTPTFYAGASVGTFRGDGGTSQDRAAGFLAPKDIASGTKTFVDVHLGAQLLPWLDLEAGYLQCAEFSTDLPLSPNILPVTATLPWEKDRLRAWRLTPVARIRLTDRLDVGVLAGLTFATGEVETGDHYLPNIRRESLNDLSWHAGARLLYRVLPSLELRADYTFYDFGEAALTRSSFTASTLSVGASWRF